MRDDDLKSFQCPQSVVIVRHQAQAVEKWLHNVTLFGKMDDMFTLERQHDDQLGNNIRKLRNPSLVQFHKILQYINIDKDGMWVWWLVTM